MSVRAYQFINGPETDDIPTAPAPSGPEDLITKQYNKKVTGSTGSPTAITGAGGITYDTDTSFNIIFCEGDGAPVDITANPQISDPNEAGDELLLIGTSDTNTIDLEHGNGIVLNGNITLGNQDMIKFVYNGTDWIEIWRFELT